MISVCAVMGLTATISLATVDMNAPTLEMDLANSPAAVAATHNGQWLESYETAQQLAKEKQLQLVVHFEADWCGPCRKMKSEVLEQDAVRQLLGTKVIAVRVNADRDPGLVSKFGIASLPTEVIVAADGKELARYVGGTTVSEYTARLDRLSTNTAAVAATAETPTDENLRPCLLVVRDGKMVGLGGYSPVAMQKDKRWIQGTEEFVGAYLGVDYYFQSAEERELFFATPEQFIPGLHGCDPVELALGRRAEAGAIELGAFYKGRLFFFSSKENRDRFNNNPDWYADASLFGDIQNLEQFPFLKSMNLN